MMNVLIRGGRDTRAGGIREAGEAQGEILQVKETGLGRTQSATRVALPSSFWNC